MYDFDVIIISVIYMLDYRTHTHIHTFLELSESARERARYQLILEIEAVEKVCSAMAR